MAHSLHSFLVLAASHVVCGLGSHEIMVVGPKYSNIPSIWALYNLIHWVFGLLGYGCLLGSRNGCRTTWSIPWWIFISQRMEWPFHGLIASLAVPQEKCQEVHSSAVQGRLEMSLTKQFLCLPDSRPGLKHSSSTICASHVLAQVTCIIGFIFVGYSEFLGPVDCIGIGWT